MTPTIIVLGTPGEHYGPEDPQGPHGPYSYNGGLCQCH